MILMAMIGRVADGLPLAVSIHNEICDDSGRGATEYQNQAENILRRLASNSTSKASIAIDPYIFHCLIDHDVCYITLCDKSFPRKNAYAYLEDLAQEFIAQYGQKIQLASRPYTFIEFNNYIQKMKKQYRDSRSSGEAVGRLETDLHDVQNSMLNNIQNNMDRRETSTHVNRNPTHLASISQQYQKYFKHLNRMPLLTKIGLVVGSIVLLSFIAYIFIF